MGVGRWREARPVGGGREVERGSPCRWGSGGGERLALYVGVGRWREARPVGWLAILTRCPAWLAMRFGLIQISSSFHIFGLQSGSDAGS